MAEPFEMRETVNNQEPRVGIVVCRCGSKMEEMLPVNELCRKIQGLPGVSWAAVDEFPCSKGGQERLRNSITRERLDRVLIAGCEPRLVGKLFRNTGAQAGLAPELVEVVDIREPCADLPDDNATALVDHAQRLVAVEMARMTSRHAVPTHVYPVTSAVLVLGGTLAGMTCALELAQSGTEVILVEAAGQLGTPIIPGESQARLEILAAEVQAHLRIHTLVSTTLINTKGRPGDYQVQLRQGDRIETHRVGAIVVALDARPEPLRSTRWVDRSRVRNQVEFALELETWASELPDLIPAHVVMLLCPERQACTNCSRVCCSTTLRQAKRVKSLLPEAQVTILFHEMNLGAKFGPGEQELAQAAAAGVEFIRFPSGQSPNITEKTINFIEADTQRARQLPYDRAVVVTPFLPEPAVDQTAAVLGLPQDPLGFLIDPRMRLRPGAYTDDGIFIIGSVHAPLDEDEMLLQAYTTVSRVGRFLEQGEIRVARPVAEVRENLCTGCGDCAQVCPSGAISLRKHEGLLSISTIEPASCTACGACVVACPVKAISLPGWEDDTLLAQIDAALQMPYALDEIGGVTVPAPHVLILGCEWSGYAAAELAAVRRLCHPGRVSMIRMNCGARMDPFHVLYSLLNGADGVLMLACPPGECHYGHGNLLARQRMAALLDELAEHGIDTRRIRLELIKGDDVVKFTRTVTEFVTALQARAPKQIYQPVL